MPEPSTHSSQPSGAGNLWSRVPAVGARTRSVALAVAAVGFALAAPSPIRVATAVAVCATTVLPMIARTRPSLAATRMLAGAVLVFGLAGGGAASLESTIPWQPLVAIIAYPLFGRALLHQVSEYRLVRRSDLLVEAALIGTATAIVLQAGLDWQRTDVVPNSLAGNGIAALLVGLDVAIVVLASWSLRIRMARRGPLGMIATGFVAFFAAHATSAVRLADGTGPGPIAEWLMTIGILAIGAAAVHTAIAGGGAVTASEPPLFSRGHAALVVISLLAAPTVLAVHSVNRVTVSATIATGTALSGLVLANYLVELLRERAAGEHQATHDALTDLPNRVLFMDRLERALAHAERNDAPVGLLYIDLDRFKEVNDTLGHHIGDELLRVTSERLRAATRHEDTVARLGGDEFAVLLPHLAEAEDVLLVADRILHSLYEPIDLADHTIRNEASIGAAVFPHDGRSPSDLVTAADGAMYEAKEHEGPAIVTATTDPTEAGTTQLQIESDLHGALQNGDLELHYQPIVDAETGRVEGAEALIRWNHPTRGLLGPIDFIPVAERSDLIVRIGDWVVQEACRQQVEWSQLGHPSACISVNISGRHFDHDLVSTMTAALRSTGANATRIQVEVTETAAARDMETIAARLHDLRELGVRVAIDDFGTGYSGMQYLADLPIDALKIDQSFVQADTPRAAAIISATIAMAHSLGLSVVAEGVETAGQRRFLLRLGCDQLQGYHFGRPVPNDQFVADFLREPEQRRATLLA